MENHKLQGARSGLSTEEAARALAGFGANVIVPQHVRPSALVWAMRIASDPMALLLAVAATIYSLLGDRIDAIVSAIALLPIIGAGVVLEGRADAALAKLRALTAPRARVIRDGREQEIPAAQVVPGDLLLIGEGDVVAADGTLIEGLLSLDESALTGESIPVDRVAETSDDAVAAGTTVTGGHGVVRVTATGEQTRYGRIAKLLGTLTTPPTPIEKAIRSLVGKISIAVALVCFGVVLLERTRGTPWALALIAGVSLGMAAVPEELPMVYTLYLSLGAWRLSKGKALVRRLGSVETLGSTTTICVDKTGTLTQGRVELAEIVAFGEASQNDVLKTGLLASDSHSSDPLDTAFARAFEPDPRKEGTLVEDIPYDARRRYTAKRWRTGNSSIFAAKGAPDTLCQLVGSPEPVRAAICQANENLAAKGMRVLAIARASENAEPTIIGLVGFRDPIRPDAPQALAECRAASIRIVMITGDHPATARAIAQESGFGADAEHVATGDELDAAEESVLSALIASTRIFARTRPEQKLIIVRELQRAGEIVAMTGDGTNDALALREANIGIAMGEHGTEVAREAAGLVLLDDDISTIVGAVRNGRRIFENLRRAFGYLVGFHMPLLGAAIILPVLGLPLLLQPIHLVWLELVVHPTSSLVFEDDPGDATLMTKPPRGPKEGILRRADWIRPFLLGLTLTAAVIAIDVWALHQGLQADQARTAALVTMFVGQTILVFVQRSPQHPLWKSTAPTRTTWLLTSATLLTLAAAIAIHPLTNALHLMHAPLSLFLTAMLLGAVSTLWLEPWKRRGQQAA